MKTAAAPTEPPAPGSEAAIDAGCTCPIFDNAHGRGYFGQAGIYVINASCPLHGDRTQSDHNFHD